MCKSTKKFLDFIIKMAFFLALFGFSLAFLLPLQTEMKKTIYQKYDKSLIPGLPRVLFEGRVFVVLTESEACKAVNYLLSQPLLGLDSTGEHPRMKSFQTFVLAFSESYLFVCCHSIACADWDCRLP